MNWKLIAAGIVLAAVAWLGWDFSHLGAERDTARTQAKQAQGALTTTKKQDAVTAKVDASATAAAQHTQIVYRTITKEVTKYVETHPANCTLPAGWVRLHNAAALGRLPDASGATHDASGAVAAAE